MKKIFAFLTLFLFIFGNVSFANAAVFKSEESSFTLSQPINDDLFVVGESVNVNSEVNGELFASGSTVDIAKRPGRSIFAAGNSLRINEGAGYNVFAAGKDLIIKGDIDHDVYAAGSNVTIDPGTHIKGSLRIAGRKATIAGSITGDVYSASDELVSSAVIGGTMKSEAQSVTFSGGSIGGNLHYSAKQDAAGLDKVTVSGTTERTASKMMGSGPVIHTWLFGFLITFVSGAAIILLMPRKVKDIVEHIQTGWGKSLSTGMIFLFLVPILSALLFASVVAWPIALIMLLLYGILLYEACIIAQIIIGDFILSRTGYDRKNWWLALAVGTVVTSLVMMVPVLSSIAGLIYFFGLVIPVFGGILLWSREKLS